MEPIIDKYPNGNIRSILYISIDLIYHREDGPAQIWYDETGKFSIHIWWNNGKKHRIDGPANIGYQNDVIILEQYWINGEELSKQEFMILNRKRKFEIINGTDNR
jgi:hypothetical protein